MHPRKLKVRFPDNAIEHAELTGMKVAAESMRQINATEITGLKLAASLASIAERIAYLIGTGSTDPSTQDLNMTIDRITRDLIEVNELRVRRHTSYGTLILALGPEGAKELLDQYPPIGVPWELDDMR